jgi:hypothetical protein
LGLLIARDYGARSRMIGGPDEDGPEVTSCNLILI